MPFASLLHLPLRQHPGRPGVAVVREGQEVVRGQLLAQPDDEQGVPLHAPATGTVVRINEQPDVADGTVPVIELEPFPGDTQEYPAGPGLDPQAASADAIAAAIRSAGLVGMGGEAWPTHDRVRRRAGQRVRTLVLNGIEVEHLFSRVPAILRTQSADVVAGTRYLLKTLGATRVVLAVEEQDGVEAAALHAAASSELPLELRVLPPRYPQGAESLLLRVLFGPRGRRSVEQSGACCFNLATVAETGRLLANGLCMTDQVITLAGAALREPGNYRVPLGTPVEFVLEHAGLGSHLARVLAGGPMRGRALATLGQPVTKGMTGFVASAWRELDEAEAALPCIRCGECVAVCPVQLHPAQLGLLARKAELHVMYEKYHLDDCLECGCCAYVCPSKIPLVQLFRAAKAQWRRRLPGPVDAVAS